MIGGKGEVCFADTGVARLPDQHVGEPGVGDTAFANSHNNLALSEAASDAAL